MENKCSRENKQNFVFVFSFLFFISSLFFFLFSSSSLLLLHQSVKRQ